MNRCLVIDYNNYNASEFPFALYWETEERIVFKKYKHRKFIGSFASKEDARKHAEALKGLPEYV